MTAAQSLNPRNGDQVQLATLAELTGFPVSLIKKELLLDCEHLEMDDVRRAMMIYLNNTFSNLES